MGDAGNFSQVWNYAYWLLGMPIVWLFRSVSDIKTHYITRAEAEAKIAAAKIELDGDLKDIKSSLTRIEDKLDMKADK